MSEGLATGDSESTEHEYEKIMIALQKSEQLGAESETCVGELSVYAGDTEVEVEEPEVSEELLEALAITLSDPALDRPAPASPYL